jgi:hypothetical protein
VSAPVFMFCAVEHVFGGAEGVGSCFSYFAHPYSFLAVPRASDTVFIFCASRLVFGGTEDVCSHFHVLRSRTHFRRSRVCQVLFLFFACPDLFSAVPRASGPVFSGTEGVGGIEGVGS